MEKTPPDVTLEGRRERRPRWILRGVIVGLLVAMAVVFIGLDGPAPDDSAMLPRWSDRGGEANPLAVFCRELQKPGVLETRRVSRMPEDEKEKEVVLRKTVERHAAAFAAFDRLMATDARTWQWPEKERICNAGWETEESLKSAQIFDGVLRDKFSLLCVDGKAEEAAHVALQRARLGRGLLGAEGGWSQHIRGLIVQRSSEADLKQALMLESATPGLLRTCSKELETLGGPSRADCQFLIQAEYLWLKNTITQLDRGKRNEMLGEMLGYHRRMGSFYGLLFKPNRTLEMSLHLELPVARALDKSWMEGVSAAQSSLAFLEDYHAGKLPISIAHDSNASGMLFLLAKRELSRNPVRDVMDHVVLHELTRVMLGLRLFELEKGRLPERLDELVPDYLRAVPEDIYAGQPMRWNRARGAVYSTGENGADDGGRISERHARSGADFGLRYWWKDESRAPR